MIKKIQRNNVLEALNLFNNYVESNKDSPSVSMYDRNEAAWISYFVNAVNEQEKGSPHYLVIGDYKDGLQGFILATSFQNYYNNQYVMDVKECAVNPDYKQPLWVVTRLFNEVMSHIKKHGGKYWRADSIRLHEDSLKYGKLLEKKYGGVMHFSVNGIIKGD